MSEGQSSYSHPLLAVLHQCVFPMWMIVPGDGWKWLGTAFLVAHQGTKDGLLFTAAHVLRQANRYGSSPRRQHPTAIPWLVGTPPPPVNSQRAAARVFLGIPHQGGYQIADVIDYWFSEEIDIGMVAAVIRPDSDVAFTGRLALDMTPATTGSRMVAVGHPKFSLVMGDQDPDTGSFRVTAGALLEVRPSIVTEQCPAGTTMYGGPGFLVDCALDSGMSGGPVIEVGNEGEPLVVRGLISGDISEGADLSRGSGAHAFVSLLLPALVMKTHVSIEGRNEPVQLIDLVRSGFIDERGGALEHVNIIELPDGRFTIR